MAKSPVGNQHLDPAALQPLNVQMAILIESVQKLTKGAKDATPEVNKLAKAHSDSLASLVKGAMGAPAVIANQFTQLASVVKNTLGGFVDAFDPTVMIVFNRVVKDFNATIGEVLVPVVQAAGGVIKFLGDSFAGLTGHFQALISGGLQAVTPILQTVGESFRQLLGSTAGLQGSLFGPLVGLVHALTPAVNALLPGLVAVIQATQSVQGAVMGVLVGALTTLAPWLEFVATAVSSWVQVLSEHLTTAVELGQVVLGVVGDLLSPVRELFTGVLTYASVTVREVTRYIRGMLAVLREFFGLKPFGHDPFRPGNQEGKGAANVSFGSPDALWENAMKAAFGMGRPAEKEAEPIKGIADDVREIKDKMEGFLKWAMQQKDRVAQGAEQFAGAAGDAAAAAALGPFGPLAVGIKNLWRTQELKRN